MTWKPGTLVRHKTKGWLGRVCGAGPTRKRTRWTNPKTLYVDWRHRPVPATEAVSPDAVEIVTRANPFPSKTQPELFLP